MVAKIAEKVSSMLLPALETTIEACAATAPVVLNNRRVEEIQVDTAVYCPPSLCVKCTPK